MQKILFIITKFCLVVTLCILTAPSEMRASFKNNSDSSAARAKRIVQFAIAAMGGEEQLRRLKTVKIDGIGHFNWLEQSERPEGPYFVTYEQTSDLLDLADGQMSESVESKGVQTPNWTARTFVVSDGAAAFKNGDKSAPGSIVQTQEAEIRLALGIERILLTALEAADLRLDRDTTMQNVSHKVVRFTWKKFPVAIFLNADTNLPTAIEIVRAHPYEHFWTVWGDVPTRVYYSNWTLQAGGVRYPMQWDTTRNGLPLRSFTVLEVALNAPLPANSFAISEEVKAAFRRRVQPTIDELPLGIPNQSAREIASGVVKISGRWDVAFIRQKDGIVIVEAPISSAYSVKVLDEAKRRFPDLPVKAVISCADSYPHIGGIREYAARGIPIYALDANRPILERMLAAPHHFYPDLLETKPRKANFKIVSNKTIVGAGENRLEIYPVRSEAGERMLMIYLPESKLLYAGDLIQKMPDDSFFMPEYLAGLMSAVKRENLGVEKVFAMHSPPVAWSEIEAAVSKAMTVTPPDNARE